MKVLTNNTVALIHQSCVEMCSDLSVGVVVQKDERVIHERFVYGRHQRTTKQILINVVAETDCQ